MEIFELEVAVNNISRNMEMEPPSLRAARFGSGMAAMNGCAPQNRHSRESGDPAWVWVRFRRRLDSRLRGSDEEVRGPAGERGFTLIELMVVIVIVGLAAAAVVLAVPDAGGSVQAEAERFAARAKAARDSAVVEARPVALAIDGAGYRVERRVGGGWQAAGAFDWAEGTSAQAIMARTRFDTTGMAEPLSLTLRRGDRTVAVDIGADGNVRVRR